MSQVIKAYQNLPPKTKQAINQAAAKTASAVAKAAVQTAQRRRAINTARRATTRTRLGQRVYDPTDLVETQAIAPVAYSTKWASGAKSMRVRQSEIVGAVTLDNTWFPSWHGTFSANTFPINPANPKTFPWLSYIARLYDKYRFHSLKFRFINSVATSTTGNVIIALDYDTLDAAPESVIEASQLAKFTMTPTYVPSEFTVPVSHPGNNPWLYTYDISAGLKDLKTYNLGNLFVCIDGLPKDGSVVGYLAVDYDVELLDKNPVISVFASKTYDTGTPAVKANRSNVDPADTLDLTYELFTAPEGDESEGAPRLRVTFPENVAPGDKLRLMWHLGSNITNNGEDAIEYVSVTAPVRPSGVTQLEYTYFAIPSLAANATGRCSTVGNYDVIVPDDRTITFNLVMVGRTTGSTFNVDKSTVQLMAYTYA